MKCGSTDGAIRKDSTAQIKIKQESGSLVGVGLRFSTEEDAAKAVWMMNRVLERLGYIPVDPRQQSRFHMEEIDEPEHPEFRYGINWREAGKHRP